MSWFRNLVAYRLGKAARAWTATHLIEQLAANTFAPCGELDLQSSGWVAPFEGGNLAYAIPGGHIFIALCTESKNLPKQVIDRKTRDRCAELEQQQGFKPGRKQTKEIREQVIDELLPRAFTTRGVTRVWIDPADGWLVIDTPSYSRADNVFKYLLRSLEELPVSMLRTERSPLSAMTDWLAADEAPAGFTVDQDTELRATGEGKATVRYIRHSLEPEDVRRHIGGGKQCTRLALTWGDRISFVLTERLVLKRIAALDVLKESNDPTATLNEDERRDTDLALMTGEFRRLLSDLVDALGGEEQPKAAA